MDNISTNDNSFSLIPVLKASLHRAAMTKNKKNLKKETEYMASREPLKFRSISLHFVEIAPLHWLRPYIQYNFAKK